MALNRTNLSRDVYIAGVGSYSPGPPIPFAQIESVLGPLTDVTPKMANWIAHMQPIMEGMLGVKYCHYAIDAETRQPTDDNVTMSVKSANKALEMAGLKITDIDLMVYAGIMMENVCPPTTTLIQEAMGLPRVAEYAIHSNCTSIYKAIQLASDQIAAGRYKNALIMTSQLSSAFLRAEHYNQKVVDKSQILLRWFLSDGAGALVLTSNPEVGRNRWRIYDTYIESIGLGEGPDMFCISGGHRVNPLEVYEKGWHHLSQNFDRVARLSVELAKKATDTMMARLNLEWPQLDYLVLNVPTKHILDQALADLRREKDAKHIVLYNKLAERGYPGPSAIVYALGEFVKDYKPKPGDVLATVVAESSKWIYGGFVLEYMG